jgi:hypothetical protein
VSHTSHLHVKPKRSSSVHVLSSLTAVWPQVTRLRVNNICSFPGPFRPLVVRAGATWKLMIFAEGREKVQFFRRDTPQPLYVRGVSDAPNILLDKSAYHPFLLHFPCRAPAVWLSLLQFHYGCRRLLRLLSNCLSVEEKQRIDCWYSKSATPFESTHRHSYPSHSSETCKHSFSSSSNPLVSRVLSFRHGERLSAGGFAYFSKLPSLSAAFSRCPPSSPFSRTQHPDQTYSSLLTQTLTLVF